MTKDEILATINRLSESDREWVGRLPENERVTVITLLTVFDADFVEEEKPHDPYDIPY